MSATQATAPPPVLPYGTSSAANAPSGFRGILAQRGFAISAGVLLVAAIAFNLSAVFLDLNFTKKHLPMRQAFDKAVPKVIAGKWVLATHDEPDENTREFLGTKDYLFCHFINAQMLGQDAQELAARFEALGEHKRRVDEYTRVLRKNPAAGLSVRLTYYGQPDTVAHIPERCYVGSGFMQLAADTQEWALRSGRTIDVRELTFEKPLMDRSKLSTFVTYVFHCDGLYTSDSLVVRSLLQDLTTRYGYYAKIELESMAPDRAAVRKTMAEFLADALPAIEQALPDWEQWKRRKD
jgi:hypothetical protein